MARSYRAALGSALILAISWSLVVLYAYPGEMSFDSAWQLREARSGNFGDWHPPAMALVWRYFDKLVSGPLLMLLAQSGLLLGGVFLLLRRRVGDRTAAWTAAVTLLFPPVFTVMGVVWKDCQMTAYLVMAISLMLLPSRAAVIGSLVLFVIGSALRYNGFTITIAPIILLFHPIPSLRGVRRYALSTATWLAVTVAAMQLNARLTDTPQYPWHGSLCMFDIVGVLRFAPDLPDATVADYLTGVPVQVKSDLQAGARAAYHAREGVFEIMRKNYMRQPRNAAERAAFATAWKRLVSDYPGAYLWHRALAFSELLVLMPVAHGDVWIGLHPNAAQLVSYDAPWIQRRVQHIAVAVGRTWITRPYLYLVLVMFLTGFAIAWRHRLGIALGLSGIVSELALFVATPTPDFRYSLWLVMVSIPLTCLLFVWRYRMRGEVVRGRGAGLPDGR